MILSFEDYYRQVTGQTPFGWQSRLAREVQTGSWPRQVELPTAAGKTSLVEIWAYALAQAVAQAVEGLAPYLCVWSGW